VALYEVATDLFFGMGDGFNDSVYDLVYAPSGRVYAAGNFVESSSTGQVMMYIAYWNGAQWFDLGGGADDAVRAIAVDTLGNVLAVGDFLRIGSVDAPYFALWNQSAWVHPDAAMEAGIRAVMFDAKGNIFCGADALASYASRTTVTNLGTATANPEIYIVGPGTLKWIENQTLGRRMYLDLAILAGEEVSIRFSEGKIESTVRGDLAHTLLPGADMRAFQLLPGENIIAALMVNDVAATMNLYYEPRHWSADATEGGEEW
jgi:hypothetical protein